MKKNMYKKAYTFGTVLAFVAGYLAWGFRPSVFYPQEKGILIDVFDTVSYQANSPRVHKRNYRNVPVYLFYVNNNVYRIEHPVKTNKIIFFDDFKNKEIYFRSKIAHYSFHITLDEYFAYNKNTNKFVWGNANQDRKIIQEIIYDGKVIYRDEHLFVFFVLFVIFIINLIWCLWAFVIYWKKPSKKNTLKEGEEEYFIEKCKIKKSDNKCFLYYVSQFDNRSIKAIEITEEEFLEAKNGKMTLEDFYSTYNLW